MKKNLGNLRNNILNSLNIKGNIKNHYFHKIGILLIFIIGFSLMNVQITQGYPTYSPYCTNCHQNDTPSTWILVTVDSQTSTDITYYVTGSEGNNGEEGWSVFNPSQTNIANGINSGYFTIPKDSQTYRVFWVDSGSGLGGTAYEDIITPESNNTTPDTPTIDGSVNGQAGTEYTYTFVSNDPDGDDLSYCIDWGDGTPEICIGPFSSGEEQSDSHTWTDQDTYIIRIKARDINDAESGYGTLEITMPRNRAFNRSLHKFFDIFPNAFPILQYLLKI
jgi:hypothetical protein